MANTLEDEENAFDFSSLQDFDPSIVDGFRVLYEKEVPTEIRYQGEDQEISQGYLETLKMKLLIVGEEESPSAIRLELSSETDLFFHYIHNIDEMSYQRVRESQKLMVDFADYPNILIKMFNSCIRDPQIYTAVVTVYTSTVGSLNIIQNMEYKLVELVRCALTKSTEETVQHHITYRYDSLSLSLSLSLYLYCFLFFLPYFWLFVI
jgi:hypothetical protein